ncbi:hypothetical protein AQJ91_16675 [Streptomyces dysideae]|uniref:Uncharacterized protein n=1 Tax=Streptomyces dysideae TaxID=909626 RepID=A0A101V063_9ACTN|nr:hypothetical protein AQJ91_16675 [Streptomyces dysideae]
MNTEFIHGQQTVSGSPDQIRQFLPSELARIFSGLQELSSPGKTLLKSSQIVLGSAFERETFGVGELVQRFPGGLAQGRRRRRALAQFLRHACIALSPMVNQPEQRAGQLPWLRRVLRELPEEVVLPRVDGFREVDVVGVEACVCGVQAQSGQIRAEELRERANRSQVPVTVLQRCFVVVLDPHVGELRDQRPACVLSRIDPAGRGAATLHLSQLPHSDVVDGAWSGQARR